MVRELIDSELDTVSGGHFDFGVVRQSIDARQTATANANGYGGFFGVGVGGSATALNIGASNTNLSVIGG
jgi:hypothetical protein